MTEIGIETGIGTETEIRAATEIRADKIKPHHVLPDSISIQRMEERIASGTNGLTSTFTV